MLEKYKLGVPGVQAEVRKKLHWVRWHCITCRGYLVSNEMNDCL